MESIDFHPLSPSLFVWWKSNGSKKQITIIWMKQIEKHISSSIEILWIDSNPNYAIKILIAIIYYSNWVENMKETKNKILESKSVKGWRKSLLSSKSSTRFSGDRRKYFTTKSKKKKKGDRIEPPRRPTAMGIVRCYSIVFLPYRN